MAVDSFTVLQTETSTNHFVVDGILPHFYPNYAEPMTNLMKKSASNSVTWSENFNTAFGQIKSLLRSIPTLNSPDFTKPFIVQTGASEFAVGAMLSQ